MLRTTAVFSKHRAFLLVSAAVVLLSLPSLAMSEEAKSSPDTMNVRVAMLAGWDKHIHELDIPSNSTAGDLVRILNEKKLWDMKDETDNIEKIHALNSEDSAIDADTKLADALAAAGVSNDTVIYVTGPRVKRAQRDYMMSHRNNRRRG